MNIVDDKAIDPDGVLIMAQIDVAIVWMNETGLKVLTATRRIGQMDAQMIFPSKARDASTVPLLSSLIFCALSSGFLTPSSNFSLIEGFAKRDVFIRYSKTEEFHFHLIHVQGLQAGLRQNDLDLTGGRTLGKPNFVLVEDLLKIHPVNQPNGHGLEPNHFFGLRQIFRHNKFMLDPAFDYLVKSRAGE